MKALLLILAATLVPALSAAGDTKSVPVRRDSISTYRIFVRTGDEDAFRKAFAAHVAKYHKGNWSLHVSQVLSGPDEGAFLVVDGPNSWTEFEDRPDLGPDHEKDYAENIRPHIERETPEYYFTFEPDASTSPAPAFSATKTLIRYYYVKPGSASRLLASLKLLKPLWEKRRQDVAVWSTFFSGEPAYVLAIRMKNGWKDLDVDPAALQKAADESMAQGTYDKILGEISADTSRVTDEMIETRQDLSSSK